MIARYRAGETLVLGWALIGAALLIFFAALEQGFSSAWLLIDALIVLVAWLIAIRPAILVYEQALVIQNVFRKHEVPWSAISKISSTLLLTVWTGDGKKISAWAISTSVRSRIRGAISRADEIAYELEQYRSTYSS